MKIAIIMRTSNEGCNFFRLWLPHKDSMEVEFLQEYKEGFDIAVYHKSWFHKEDLIKFHKEGVKIVFDFDDWIEVPPNHLLYEPYNKATPEFIRVLKASDLIITTTKRLRGELLQFNKNVEVLPNALESQEILPTNTKRMTFGYMGGKCHLPDLKLLAGVNDRLMKINPKSYYFNLYGYYNDQVKNDYIRIISGSHPANVNVCKFVNAMNYLKLYNTLDVSLVPLIDDLFNGLKSELKMIEAGFYKKAVIVSNVYPYIPLISDKNCIKIDNIYQWTGKINYCIKNPNFVRDIGEQLYNDVKDKYNLEKVTKKRFEIYKNLIK
jgi:glycosyltransferase involved in cell wall biosynthesis